MRSFALSILLFAGSWASASPNGSTGNLSKWKPEWTRDFNDCFGKEAQSLKAKTPTDKGQYCDGSPSSAKYWLSIFVPLAGKESNFDPSAHGQNGGRVPIGLFQMDSTDMKSHKCEGADPANAKQSICCAIKIADDEAKKFNKISQPGAAGIMSAFWQPMKDGQGGDGKGHQTVNNTKNHTDIKDQSKNLCSNDFAAIGGSGGDGIDISDIAPGTPSQYSQPAATWQWNPSEYARRPATRTAR
jgi:hypothetical protein